MVASGYCVCFQFESASVQFGWARNYLSAGLFKVVMDACILYSDTSLKWFNLSTPPLCIYLQNKVCVCTT